MLAVVLASCIWAIVTGERAQAAIGALVALASLARGSLTRASTPAQALLMVLCGVVAVATAALFPGAGGMADRALPKAWPVIGAGALLLASARTHLKRPDWGIGATLGLGLLVFLSCGSVMSGPVYPALLVPYVMLCFCALRADDAGSSQWRRLGARHVAAFSLILVASSAFTTGLVAALPHVYDRVNRWAYGWIEQRAQSGFHDGPMPLGSLEGMLQSDEIVMRVHGRIDQPLRGNVYSQYSRWGWLRARQPKPMRVQAGAPLPSGDGRVAEIRYASDKLDRFFLPRDSRELQLVPARARVDATGVVRTLSDEHPELVRLRLGGPARFSVSHPGPGDLQLPGPVEETLRRIARSWTVDARNPRERLAAIRSRLETDYSYSLSFERGDRDVEGSEAPDPVLNFLLETPRGHCEYFASAMALLARAVGVPARVVTGYRVSERNPFAEYFIVRERHAHAWVEAHLADEGWVTVDPSPIRSFEGPARNQTAWLPALLDLGIVSWQRHGPAALLASLVFAFAAIQIARLLRGSATGRSPGRGFVGPPAYMQQLFEGLRALGLRRAPAETLEAYARRIGVPAASGSNDPRVCGRLLAAEPLLLRYAALCYGDRGSRRALREAVRAWLRAAR